LQIESDNQCGFQFAFCNLQFLRFSSFAKKMRDNRAAQAREFTAQEAKRTLPDPLLFQYANLCPQSLRVLSAAMINRREFLRSRTLAENAGHVLGVLDEVAELEQEPRVEAALLRVAQRAMATRFEVLIPFGTPSAQYAALDALSEIDRLESQLTVYRDTSEVSRLNQLASSAPIPVEEGLFDLLQLAARINAETEGAFDISAGALIKAWGFFKGPRRVPSETERRQALSRVGMSHVALDAQRRQVRYLRAGLEINLGSIGKGYALDRAARILTESWNLPSLLVHGGQSSVLGKGNEPGSKHGWPVGIRHPWDPEARLAVVRLKDRALGTSAATFQHLEHEGRKLGHILDPRTGWPAEGMASASVLAPTAAEADALATAFFILGIDKARAYCAAHPEIGAILLARHEAAPVVLNLSPADVSLAL
jgi:thiamine biosynthesis lipoprotein